MPSATHPRAATLTIRFATRDDVALIVRQRHAMFTDMKVRGSEDLTDHDATFEAWVRRKLAGEEYVGWLVENEEGTVVAGAGLWIMDWPPHPIDPPARRGCVLNVYVEPEYRRQGLAQRLVVTLIEWCRREGIRILILNASDEGRPLYTALGFKATNEMTLIMAEQEPDGRG